MRQPRRVFYGSTKRQSSSLPDPYGPSAPGHEERNQITEVAVAPGVTRIDIGEPIKIIGVAARSIPAAPAAGVAAVSEGTPVDAPTIPVGAPKARAERGWRDDYGMAKRP